MFYSSLDFPVTSHWLIDQLVRSIVVNEELCLRIEVKCTSESVSADTHVHDSSTVISVVLVESELLSCVNAVDEVCVLWLWIWKLVDDILNVRNSTLEALVYLSEWSLDIRYLTLALEALTLKDDLATVSVSLSN